MGVTDNESADYRLGWLRVTVETYLDALDSSNGPAIERSLASLRRDVAELEAYHAARMAKVLAGDLSPDKPTTNN